MQPSHSLPSSYDYCGMGNTPFPQQNSLIVPSSNSKLQSEQSSSVQKKKSSLASRSKMNDYMNCTRFGAPLVENHAASMPTPQSYRPNLTPRSSHLRPHCLARDRLRLWVPVGGSTRQLASTTGDSNTHEVSDEQLNRILEVMGSAWAQSTKETYGAGLLVFHVYCDLMLIEENKRCPVSSNLLLEFLSSCAGAYSGSAIANYAAGIKAWHLLHSRLWLVCPNELKAMLEGANVLAPSTSKRPKRRPFTPDFLSSIREPS